MAWQQLKISIKAEHAEAVGDMLSANQAQAVTFLDAKDTPMYEPKPGEVLLWPDTQVIGLYDASVNLVPIIERIGKASVFKHEFLYSIDQLEDKDWEREWMENFHPMQFGKRLWICPSWRSAPDPNAVNVLLDPGLAFGTGTHPTTSMCLRWLDSQDIANKTVVDFGCGSGILAIAALKLGAKSALGIDIDPQALIASKSNAEQNHVNKQFSLYLADQQPDVQSDIVIANILSGPLKTLKSKIASHCKSGGWLVMSGVLVEQAQDVVDAYSDEFQFDPIEQEGEWARISAKKR
ncbi:50S ribosomal protein L11 methyltransferase [Agaribacter marinus]|uniref:Ribosomal protein L11 methyltransferase n=1 Tax=Agaribacter marinus TaxID=1431249 RepID=A0AA37SZW0_9ALTE|nr:50S ribosomal protein L11 methyltransferase [Agaribacter marinus]GLR71469.1 ribosomal protein L11 methyltransferase [Agaribacter marinus]